MSHCKEKISDEHAFADTTGRFPVDDLIRRHGYIILVRKGKTVKWQHRLTKEIFAQAKILSTIDKKLIKQATDAENDYLNARYG